MGKPSRIAMLVSVAGGVLTALAVLLPPVLYYVFAYQYLAGHLEAQAGRDRGEITRIIEANPALWTFQQTRISDILAANARYPDDRSESIRIRDAAGKVVAERASALARPQTTCSLPLYDAGVEVGRIEVSRSLRPLLLRAALFLGALLPFGLFALHVLRTVPLRAIEEGERALRHERDTAQKYLDVAGVALVIVDAVGRVQLVNRMGSEILGRSVEEILGRDWIAGFVEPSSRARVAEQLRGVREGTLSRLEYDVVRPSGERREVSWYLTPLGAGQGASVLGSGVDMTEHHRLEEQLRQAQKMEAVGRLAGGVAHEFNNVLSTIRGYASVLAEELPEGSPLRQDAAEILAGTERARVVTRSLLTLSYRQLSRPAPVEVGEVVRRAERLLRPLLREGIDLRVVRVDEPLPVLADGAQLEQVLVNLVTNAYDATPAGGRIVITFSRVEVGEREALDAGLSRLGAYARISVADTGVGIDPSLQARIFEPFFTTKRLGEGTGLGLAISYGIVQQHGGALLFSSEPGGGTTFSLLIPLAEAEQAEAARALP